MRRNAVVACLAALAAACSEAVAPGRPRPTASILDGAHGAGNSHFYFLPPLVRMPVFAGEFDRGVTPEVVVCRLVGTDCAAIVVAFDMTGPGSEAVRLDTVGEHYHVNWHTDLFALDPEATYRIRVLVHGAELGHADVDVVTAGRELRNVDTGEYVPLLNGRTLPIKFRIEVGAVFTVGPMPDTIVAADGAVTLELPANALGGATGITVTPTAAPRDPRVAPGTAYDFGPDGLAFLQPVRLTISYDPARLGSVAEGSLRLHKVVDGGLLEVVASTVDTSANTVTGMIVGFSSYIAAQGGSVSFNGVAGLNGAFRAVWGSAPDDVFVLQVHPTSGIRHFDGTSWSSQAPGTNRRLEGLWGSSASNIYGVGDGVIVRYDGSTWQPVFDPVRETGQPSHIAVGDVNGDGRPDLVQGEPGQVSVLLGNGAGGFGTPVVYPHANATFGPRVLLGRVDGGASLDLVYEVAGGFAVRLGDGGGGFGAPLTVATGSALHAVADVNGDGSLDVVSAAGPGIRVDPGNGTGGFGPAVVSSALASGHVGSLATGDINGDGRADLVVLAQSGDPELHVLVAASGGAFLPTAPYALARRPLGVALAEINGDGMADLAVTLEGPEGMGTALADGLGGFGAVTSHPEFVYPEGVQFSDVDGDSRLDVVASSVDGVHVAIGLGGGAFGQSRFIASSGAGQDGRGPHIGVGDVTGDGTRDLIAIRSGVGVSVLVGRGGGDFDPAPNLRGVWGTGPANVYAVGDNVVMHYDGSGWSVPRSDPTEFLRAVWGATATDIHVVGAEYGPLTLRFDGAAWTRTNHAAPGRFQAVWGSSPTNVYATGPYAGIWRFDGSAWTPQATPPSVFDGPISSWQSIWGTSATDIYVVGGDPDERFARVLYYNGTSWVWLEDRYGTGPHAINGVWGSSSNDVWLAGVTAVLRGTR